MKHLYTTITTVTKVDSDSRGNIRINTADSFCYPKEGGMEYAMERDWLYLGFGDTDINLNDYVRIDTYYHLEADMESNFIFDKKGVHEVVTKLNRPLVNDEWLDFAHFIANESTHPISSYPEDGTFTRCPYSTIDRAIAAFRVYQNIVKAGTYDWSQLAAIRDIDCSDSGHYYDDFDNMLEQENPEPAYDYDPSSFECPEEGITALEELKKELTSKEEAKLEESDKFFEKLGLLD